MFWRVQRLLTGLSRRSCFFGLSGHRVGVLGLLKTAPSAGSVHVAGLCIRDWFRATPLEIQHKPSNRKQPDKLEGCMNKKNISHFLSDTNWILISTMYLHTKVFCKIIPILNTQHKTSGKTRSPIVTS